MKSIVLTAQDVLLIVDVQRDFLPGGALAVANGNEVVPSLNRYITLARRRDMPIYASRDWHPRNHCSFKQQGGPWPEHCVAGTRGAEFAPALELPRDAVIIDKATTPSADAYSAFSGTDLLAHLRKQAVRKLLVGGLATDYCVLNTVLDARAADVETLLLADAIRAVNIEPGDGERAMARMVAAGAMAIRFDECA